MFERTPTQAEVFARLGVIDEMVDSHFCDSPAEFTVASAELRVPDAVIEPVVNVLKIERLLRTRSPISADDYDCSAVPSRGEVAVCGENLTSPTAGTLILSYETEEPLPLAHAESHFELGFAFDGTIGDDYEPPLDRPRDYYRGTDTWFRVRYRPELGWTLSAQIVVDNVPVEVATGAFAVIDSEVVTLVVPNREFARNEPNFRFNLVRHTGDFGRLPPHDWSGYMYPVLPEPLR